MRMDVNPSRAHDAAGGIDLLDAGGGDHPDRRDAARVDRDVTSSSRTAGSIDHGAAASHQLMCHVLHLSAVVALAVHRRGKAAVDAHVAP